MSWYLLQTKFRQESNVDFTLTERGYTTYLPLSLADKKLNRSTKHTTCPFFPTYLFFSMIEGQDDFHPISKVPGVLRIVKMTPCVDGYYRPTAVPDSLIRDLKQRENDMGIHDTDNDYKSGDRIRITYGALKDIEAIVQAKTADDRVAVLLNILGGQKRVELKYNQIQPVA